MNVYTFAVNNKKQEKIEVTVRGCIVESGASTNIVDKQRWEWLNNNISSSDRKLYPYASQTPLDVIGTFCYDVIAGGNSDNAEFCMINGEGDPLLGKETAVNLGEVTIGIEVAAVHSSKNIGEILQEKQLQVFNGFGKLKGRSSTSSQT